ncbi:MAG TPA: class I SAM-dependent methyltransferase [Acidimicrobiales bacterium]
MLTVDYRRLGVRPGDRLLDLGCGGGRHAYEAFRRGATVVALDADGAEVKDVAALCAAMAHAGEVPEGAAAAAVQGDALRLPFPDAAFDRVIAAEVLEHLPDDASAAAELARVLRPGGTIAVTVPAWLAERVCWALSDDYHAPAVPGGHVRVYTEPRLRALLRGAGLRPGWAHHAHALHTPYWWLRCAVGPQDDDHPLVRAYHRLLVWDLGRRPLLTRVPERLLNPVLGKSIVVYATKPC